MSGKIRILLGASVSLMALDSGVASAQVTPGDASGTPAAAGTGQSAASSTNASARSAPGVGDGENSGDIVVTARRVEERLQDVPISITVFNQQQIANRNIVNAADLATYTPSLSTNANYGTEFTSFAIRGFVQDPTTAPSVGVYFADVVVPRGPSQGTQAGDGAGPGNLFDLQNIQVLKGPQGTLFGRNTTGGAILLVPQKPTGTFGGYVEGSYGNYDMKRVQGAINVPLSNVARLRIAGDYLNRDGYLKNISGVGPRDFNDVNYYSLRASLVVDLTPDLENYTIASYTHSKTNGSSKKAIACAPTIGFGASLACPQLAREAAAGYTDFYDIASVVPNPKSRISQWQIINTTTWRASDTLTIKNIASYSELSAFQRTSLFGTDWRLGIPALGIPTEQIYFATLNPAPGLRTVNQSTFSEELQVQGSGLGGKLTYQGGGYLEVSDPLGPTGFQSPFAIACSNPDTARCTDVLGIGASAALRNAAGVPTPFAFPIRVGALNYTVGRTSFRDVGVYSQASYAITETLKLTGGVRYTWDRTTNVSTKYGYSFAVIPPFTAAPIVRCTDNTNQLYDGTNCVSTAVQKSSKPTWLIDLDYKPVEDLLIYGKYARGYRTGGIGVNSPTNYRTFGPEKVDSYEAGLKATFRGTVNGTFNVAGFYNDFSNQQIQAGFVAAPGAPVSSTAGPINAGKSRLWGGEVEASVALFRGFGIDASYTYLNTKIRKVAPIVSTDPNYTVSFQILPGNPLPLSPKNKFSVTGHYTLPLQSDVGRVTLGATITHTDRQLTTYFYTNSPANQAAFGGNLGTIPHYNLLNLNLDWKGVAGTPIDVSLFATNVLQKHYLTYVGGLGSAGFETAVLGQPRMYGARLRYNFGS